MNITGFFNFAQGLASVRRFSSHRLCNPESVLEHTAFVANMALIVGLELGFTIHEMMPLLTRAIVHDWEEERTGDILRPVKHSSPEMLAMFEKLKPAAMTHIFNNIDADPQTTTFIAEQHDEAKDGMIGFVVDLCDKAAVVYKIYDEVLLRNNLTLLAQARRNLDHMVKLDRRLHSVECDGWFDQRQRLYLLGLIGEMRYICEQAAGLDRGNTGEGTVDEGSVS